MIKNPWKEIESLRETISQLREQVKKLQQTRQEHSSRIDISINEMRKDLGRFNDFYVKQLGNLHHAQSIHNEKLLALKLYSCNCSSRSAPSRWETVMQAVIAPVRKMSSLIRDRKPGGDIFLLAMGCFFSGIATTGLVYLIWINFY